MQDEKELSTNTPKKEEENNQHKRYL